ncbi:helix-turn-helix domain-containing protein [Paenibacillus chitinolyticus]
MNDMRIGDFIQSKRMESGFKTKKDFADVTGVSPATLSRVENNTQKPTPETLIQISRHLTGTTYGELMKKAGYLEGLKGDHEAFLTNFFNENEALDNKVISLLESLYAFRSIDADLQTELMELFLSPDVADLYKDSDINDLKNNYYMSDYSPEQKKEIIGRLETALKKYSPKLGEYLSLIKSMKPIPLVGAICAGDGIIANEEIEEYLNFPSLSKPQPDYALKVKGDSMINAGIQDGDIVYLRKQNWAEFNGQIVAVIINGEEGTLKRMKWSEGSAKFQLCPENDVYQTKEVTPNEFIVCGVYAGHYRPS